MTLTFMQQHMFLDRMVERKKRENGKGEEEDEDRPAPLISSNQLAALMAEH